MSWPLHDIAIINIVWCVRYKRRVRARSCIAQQSCNSMAIVWAMQVGWGNERMIDSRTKAVKYKHIV